MKRKIISIILTVFISMSVFVVPIFASTAHGPNNLIPTPYGTCTYEFYYDNANPHDVTIGGVTFPGTGPVHSIKYTFTQPYTGTFDIDLNNSSILNNIWNLLTSNCYLLSVVDDDTLRFAVNNAEYCEIIIIPSQYYNALFINLKNQNLEEVQDTMTAVNSILSHVTYMDGQIQNMHADTTMIRNLLISLSGYTADSDDNIATDFDTLISAMSQVGETLDSIDMGISSLLLSDKLPIYSGPFIDLLDVNNANWKSDIQGTYTEIIGNSYTYDVYLLSGFKYVWLYAVNRDVSTIRPIFTSSNVTSAVTRTLRSHNLTYYMVETTVSSSNRYTFTWNATTNFNIYPLYFGTDWSLPSELMFITRNAFNDMYTSKLDGVINAINNMSLNVNNLTVNATGITYNVTNNEVNTSITEYNTNINQVYNIENDFSNDFDTYNENYVPNLQLPLESVENGSRFYNNLLSDLYEIPIIKYPTMITIVGIILLAFLGV